MSTIEFEVSSAIGSNLDDDSFPIVQYDGLGDEPRVESVELHHQFGFASRPRDPETDNDSNVKEGRACNLLVGFEGDTKHAWLLSDPRFVATFPHLKKGGSMQYCAADSFIVMDGDDGTVTTYVPVPGDKAHVQTIGLDGNNDPYVGLVHSEGMAITMLGHSLVIKNAAGDAYIEINDDGITFNGNAKAVGGLLVGDVTAALPGVRAPALITALTAIAAALDASFGACTPPQPPKFVALVGGLTAALPNTLFKAF